MKVAHLTTVDLSLRFLVFPQLDSITRAGGEAVGISAPGPWVEELEAAGVRHVALLSSTRGVNLVSDVRAAWQLWRILREEGFDVLHTHNPKPGLYGRVLGRLAGVPIVVNTVHGLYATPDDPWMKRFVVYALEAIASRFSDAELIQNLEDLELISRLHLSPRANVLLLGNGVDLVRFDPDRFDDLHRARIRRELGVGSDEILIGIVGRLVAEKGYPELFEAFAELDDRFRLVCIGPHDPDKSDALTPELVASAEVDGVMFLGMRDDVDELYPALDMFVLPSHREGFPRAAMEAAASGLPLVATDIRGCRQVVDDGVTGLLVPVGESRALAAAFRQLADNPQIRRGMGEAGRARALEHFDEAKVVERVLAAYQRVADRKGLSESLGPNSADAGTGPIVRRATSGDPPFLARVHSESIATGFLPSLGLRFMRLLYGALIDWDEAVVLIAEVSGQKVGFVSGVRSAGAFYRHFLRGYGLRAIVAAVPALLRPSVLWRAVETLRYGGDAGPEAELLSMAVVDSAQHRGIGSRLGARFIDQLAADSIRVVVSADNSPAIGAYEKMGFVRAGITEVHAGEVSLEMHWSSRSQ